MSSMIPGVRVRILKDCRDNVPSADGQIGTFEGYFVYDDVTSTEPLSTIERFTKGGNPRIRLEDGSCIWGIECWWDEVEDKAPPLRVAQVMLDQKIKEFRNDLEDGIYLEEEE